MSLDTRDIRRMVQAAIEGERAETRAEVQRMIAESLQRISSGLARMPIGGAPVCIGVIEATADEAARLNKLVEALTSVRDQSEPGWQHAIAERILRDFRAAMRGSK